MTNDNAHIPVTLNCWKHHSNFISDQIKKYAAGGLNSIEELKSKLLLIGDSQTDLYTGDLTPKEISVFIVSFLMKQNMFEQEAYGSWLTNGGAGYRLIRLPDTSDWVLRTGEDEKNYVHIHPGRNTRHTIRVRALSLKTAIASIFYGAVHSTEPQNLRTINSARHDLLQQAPLKSLRGSKLIKIITLLS